MTTDTLHPLAADYLERLRRAGRDLPAGRRRELLAEIEGHLSEAIEPGASDAQALTVLDRLGEPEAIIAAEMPPPEEAPERRGVAEWAAIILLPFGGFIIGLGWLVGLILLWSSRAWTTRDKWIGTLVIPGGLATAWSSRCSCSATRPSNSARAFRVAYRTAPTPPDRVPPPTCSESPCSWCSCWLRSRPRSTSPAARGACARRD